jgi:hypothetical protein
MALATIAVSTFLVLLSQLAGSSFGVRLATSRWLLEGLNAITKEKKTVFFCFL